MSGRDITFEDFVDRFQSASQILERSYRELQARVASLTIELEKEREERVRLERLAAMGELAMDLAQELRNPLGSIELYASMLDGKFAEQIVRSVRLLNHSVTNVLQFGKPIAPVLEQISIPRLLDGVHTFLQPIAQQKNLRISTKAAPDCAALADYELLHRMLLNLVLNALRETPPGGSICMKARKAGPDVFIEVEDTGPGIPKDRIGRIFDPMFSTNPEGCGLGLSIVKRIIESHCGTIAVESSPAGTRFLISIPHNMEVVRESFARC